MVTESPVMTPLTRALKGRVPYAEETAAAILSVSVRPAKPLGRRGRKKGGKIRVSKRDKTATFVAARNATMNWTRLLVSKANAVLIVTSVSIASPYLALAGLVIFADLRSLATKHLDERHRTIVYAMWKRNGSTISQRAEMLLPGVNRELRALGKTRMTSKKL